MPLFGNEKGHNSVNYGRIMAVIELIRAFMVINLVMKFEDNPLIITQVIERTSSRVRLKAEATNNTATVC